MFALEELVAGLNRIVLPDDRDDKESSRAATLKQKSTT